MAGQRRQPVMALLFLQRAGSLDRKLGCQCRFCLTVSPGTFMATEPVAARLQLIMIERASA